MREAFTFSKVKESLLAVRLDFNESEWLRLKSKRSNLNRSGSLKPDRIAERFSLTF